MAGDDRATYEGIVISTNFSQRDGATYVFGELALGKQLYRDISTIHFEAAGEDAERFDGHVGHELVVSGVVKRRFDRPLARGRVGWRRVLTEARVEWRVR